jgi:hypothetical protein
MHFTRARDLLVAGIVGLAFAYLLFEFAYGGLPRLPALAGVSLLALAVLEFVLAFSVRTRIRAGRVVTGLTIARAVVLAKASSMLGALMLGVWLGALAFLLPRTDRLTAAEADLPSALVGAPSAAALIGAALWLEHCCRAPGQGSDDERERDRDHPGGTAV